MGRRKWEKEEYCSNSTRGVQIDSGEVKLFQYEEGMRLPMNDQLNFVERSNEQPVDGHDVEVAQILEFVQDISIPKSGSVRQRSTNNLEEIPAFHFSFHNVFQLAIILAFGHQVS